MSITRLRHIRETEAAKSGSVLDLKLSELFWLVGFNALLFEMPIQNSTGFTYIDEAMTLCLFAAALLKVASGKAASRALGPWSHAAILLLFVVVLLGLIGNAVWGVQTNPIPILIDVFTCVKFPIALISAYVVLSDRGVALFWIIEIETKFVTIALLALGVANLFVDFGMGTDPRYGLRASFMAVFGHPTYLVFACVGLSVILLADRGGNLPWIIAELVVIALSLRSKGLVYSALVLVLLVLFSRKNRLSIFQIATCVMLALLIAYDQYDAYYQTDGFARTELLRSSLDVARDCAPFGSGFATYGSAVTATFEYYSPLYYKYGLSTVWGLIPGEVSFLSDTFWPTVLAQFGWIGLLLYSGVILSLFLSCYRINTRLKLATVCCFLYLLISSTSESAFFNLQSVYLAYSLAIALLGSSVDNNLILK